jgi:hypothetical protein
MNYILSQINRRIAFLESDNQKNDLKIYYQSKFEFYLVYILSYLWNQNLESLDINDKEYVFTNILKPSIGTIVSISRKLDINNEFFGNKKLRKIYQLIGEYPTFRNEKIGHGFSFEDDTDNYLHFFKSFFEIIEEDPSNKIFKKADIIKVLKVEVDHYKGISFKNDGANYLSWSCPKGIYDFQAGDIYLHTDDNTYIRVSPFILLENESEFYSFCAIEEKLTGRTKYNRLLKTASISIEVPEFEKLSIMTDSFKRKASNGSVINLFENNFKKYIDVGIATKILEFLEKNRSSVFATLWGHGGVGKTASIQRVCEILCNREKKIFDYIVFLSAKDRLYNYYQGKINPIKDGVTSLEDIIIKTNIVLSGSANLDLDTIKKFEGKVFLIIDDFETFSKQEKDKIILFLKQLDIDHHKVVLTTRAATLITGEEIQTKELDEEESVQFLVEAIKNEIPSFNIQALQKELKIKDIRKKVFEITSGRPLFLLQLGIFAAQKGTLNEALSVEIKSTKEAINFLYDRLYDYLSTDAKNMFLAISLLVDEKDLSGLLDNLRFVLGKEDKEEDFQNSLNELVKLKLVTITDKDFFKVYSPEIYKLMTLYYQNKGPEFEGNINNRFKLISTDKSSPTEVALLENADASRLLETEAEVENKYRYILNRYKTPFDIKLTALFNFGSYLISHKNKVTKALKLYQDYEYNFRKNYNFIRNYASCAWAVATTDSRYTAIQILQDFLSTKPKLNQETFLEFMGMLLTYKSIMLVSERDELKQKLKFREISKSRYNILYEEQKERFKEVYIYPGKHMYNIVKNLDLMTLSPNCRNLVLDGLTHFIEISIRVGKKHIGKEICNKIISEMPYNYHNPFTFKLNKINYIENPEKFDNDFNRLLDKPLDGDLGIKLKDALSKK